jgi:TldD protein
MAVSPRMCGPLVRLSVQVIAEQNGRRETGSSGGGARTDYSHFTDDVIESYAQLAVSQALVNLEARPAPAGTMTVVLGPGWPGVLLHEAIGHGLEATSTARAAPRSRAGSASASPRPASPSSTMERFPGRRGSLTVDDEGTPTTRTVLIEDGVLRTYCRTA